MRCHLNLAELSRKRVHVMTGMMQEVLGRALVLENFLAVIRSQEEIDELLNEPADGMASILQF